jgi:L,D-peptidoglycan transpeptidase YkuD (ErfK/YbiS/YcfS/YnhG family)
VSAIPGGDLLSSVVLDEIVESAKVDYGQHAAGEIADLHGDTRVAVRTYQRARPGDRWRLVRGPMPGRIGYNGFSANRREGDGTTPAGTFGFVYGFGSVILGASLARAGLSGSEVGLVFAGQLEPEPA